MKKLMIIATVCLLSTYAKAKVMTPMGIVEKTSYQISGLANKGLIDSHFVTDSMVVEINKTVAGFDVLVTAASANADQPNQLNLSFDLSGKATAYKAKYISASSQSPLFPRATAAEILDLGAEAFVDHLGEAAENVTVAENVSRVELSVNSAGVLLDAHLVDGRIYHLQMDLDGKVIARGF